MAELLRTGHTMLNLSCPVCNNPLFRNRAEQIFCPICNRLVKVMDDNPSNNKSIPESNKDGIESTVKDQSPNLINLLKTTLLDKLEWITKGIKSEIQIGALEKKIAIISDILELLNKLEDYNI